MNCKYVNVYFEYLSNGLFNSHTRPWFQSTNIYEKDFYSIMLNHKEQDDFGASLLLCGVCMHSKCVKGTSPGTFKRKERQTFPGYE